MGGMFIEKPDGTLVRGRKRTDLGVHAFDDADGEWKTALSAWQEEELVKRLSRKRSLATRVAELADIEDPGVLSRLEARGGKIGEAVKAYKQDIYALRVGKPNVI